jgi:EmrB/QacA subfamily drug resistance transporter
MTAPAVPPAGRPTPVLAVLLLAGVSFALSQTMVIPALPAFAGELGASNAAASWVLTGYLLSASVATPVAGKLGDLFGKGRVLCGVLLLFSLGSTVCALADSIGVMIAGRVVQGVAGGVFPLSFGIIRDTFPPERVPGGIGLMSAIFGIGGGIGLPLSGVVVDSLDLSWLFWIGLIALPAAVAAFLVVPPSPPRPRTRVDWLGAALLSAALVALLLGVTEANDWGWLSPGTLGLIGAGLALAAVWLRVEARVRDPLIDLRILRRRAVATTNLAGFLVGFAMFSSFLLIPQFAQAPERTGYGFNLSVTESGLILAPSALVQLLVGPLAGRLGARLGFRVTLAIGAGLSTAAFLTLALEHGQPWHFIVAGTFLGAGIAFAFASMANLIVAAVPQSDVGIATGINTIMRTVGGAFGSAAATAILTADTLAGSPVPTESAYTTAFLVSAAGGVLAIGAALLVPPRLTSSPLEKVAFDRMTDESRVRPQSEGA